jgi:hypothetical protein
MVFLTVELEPLRYEWLPEHPSGSAKRALKRTKDSLTKRRRDQALQIADKKQSLKTSSRGSFFGMHSIDVVVKVGQTAQMTSLSIGR